MTIDEAITECLQISRKYHTGFINVMHKYKDIEEHLSKLQIPYTPQDIITRVRNFYKSRER